MTFAELPIGQKFWFMHGYDSSQRWAYEWDWHIKTSPRFFERVWQDGSKLAGRVGVGDQVVTTEWTEGR